MYRTQTTILQNRLQKHADQKIKTWWENYVKQSAPFRGVKMSVIRSVMHKWYQEFIKDVFNDNQQIDLALGLLKEKHTEDKLAGTLFLQEILLPAGAIQWKRDIPRFAELFADGNIYDWNLCDWFCVKVLGPAHSERRETMCHCYRCMAQC